jgi:hypothetical protein
MVSLPTPIKWRIEMSQDWPLEPWFPGEERRMVMPPRSTSMFTFKVFYFGQEVFKITSKSPPAQLEMMLLDDKNPLEKLIEDANRKKVE